MKRILLKWLVLVFVFLQSDRLIALQITFTGDNSPTYNGTDNPFNVSGDLEIGTVANSSGSMQVTTGGVVDVAGDVEVGRASDSTGSMQILSGGVVN